jgi:hypothetical protein
MNVATATKPATPSTAAPIIDQEAEQQRLADRLLVDSMKQPTVDIFALGALLGDQLGVGQVLGGSHCNRLTAEARAGRLPTVEDVDWIIYADDAGKVTHRLQRSHIGGCHVARAWLKIWLDEHGTDDDKKSRAAKWAAHKPLFGAKEEEEEVPVPAAADSDLDAVRSGTHFALDVLSLRAIATLLGDSPERPMGPHLQILCIEAHARLLEVDDPAAPLQLMGKSRASRAAVRRWLCVSATGGSVGRQALADWALHEKVSP